MMQGEKFNLNNVRDGQNWPEDESAFLILVGARRKR